MDDWNGSLDHTMPDLVARSAARFGDAPFVIAEDGEALSFAGLRDEASRIAAGLIAHGVMPGDRIAIWAPNGAGWIVAACAAGLIGAVMVPINTRFRAAEAGYVLSRARAAVLFTVAGFVGKDYVAMLRDAFGGPVAGRPIERLEALSAIVMLPGEAAMAGTIGWEALIASGAGLGADAVGERSRSVRPSDTCDILFTSGTTGQPKGAMHGHGQALWMAQIWNRSNDLRAGDRALIVNPFFHSFGYRAGWVSALIAGMTVYPVATFIVEQAMRAIAEERITVLMGPPTLFTAILDHPERERFDLASLRVGHTGSSNVPVALILRARAELNFDLFLTSYGLTEATALVSVCWPDDSAETIANTVGHALPGTELRVIDPDGRVRAAGESGELLVRGPNVMQGYFEDPAATAKAIDAEGWLHTGDVASIDADGLLTIHDRLKDVVIVGGFNAYPAEIEHVLATHPAIAEAAVIALPDARMGEVCAACVVLRPGKTLDLATLTAWSRERMANFKVPRHLFLYDALPRTPLGKVQKFALKARALDEAGG